jgi:hypothetical protein
MEPIKADNNGGNMNTIMESVRDSGAMYIPCISMLAMTITMITNIIVVGPTTSTSVKETTEAATATRLEGSIGGRDIFFLSERPGSIPGCLGQ